MTPDRTNFSPFRGNCTELSKINEIPIDIALLAQESKPAFEGEPTRKFFPVRSQLTWFRLKNGNSGTIQTEIVDRDDFIVVVKATVTVDGVAISNAFGSANSQNDDQDGMGKLIETAESRAIARALDFAGYGCQLDLNTFDDQQDLGQKTPEVAAPTPNDETGASIPQHGTISKKAKVDANAPSEIIDIHDLEAAQAEKSPAEEKKPRRRSKKSSTEDTSVEQPVMTETALTAEAELNAPDSTPDPTTPIPANAEPVLQTEKTSQLTLDSDLAPETAAGSIGEHLPVDDDPLTPEQKVWNFLTYALSRQSPDPELDPRFFGRDNHDPSAYFVNDGNTTKMRNRDLQWALGYLEEHSEEIMGIKYPSSKGQFVGLTFGEIYETLALEHAETATLTCKKLYRGNNVPAYAATLLLAEKIKNR